jgi:hypothetical protein
MYLIATALDVLHKRTLFPKLQPIFQLLAAFSFSGLKVQKSKKLVLKSKASPITTLQFHIF